MFYFSALLMGLVEGITEFLPVSSTGHLILLNDMLGLDMPDNKLFEVVIQFGAILAVCVLYREKLFATASGLIRRNPPDINFMLAVLIGFLPAMVIGAIFHDFIKQTLFNPWVVSTTLVLGGVVLIWVEKLNLKNKIFNLDALPKSACLKIGLFQCLAMIPGTSRSGATIIGAMLLGVERKTAAEYSFFLAIPTMFAATIYDLYKARHDLTTDGLTLIVIGFIAAFFAALGVVKGFVSYISRHGFAPFGWYRIGLGLLMFALLFLR